MANKKRRYTHFPTLAYINGVFYLWIGPTSSVWKLQPGEKLHFRKHGTIHFVRLDKTRAHIEVTFFQKQWNPGGTRKEETYFSHGHSVMILQGKLLMGLIKPEELERLQTPSPFQVAS